MDISPQFALLIPVIVGLVEVLRGLKIKDRFLPIVSIVLGLGLTWILGEFNILQGLVVGLSASGLYSGGKAVIGK